MDKITIRDLLDAGVHFGHPTSRWNPKMKPYIHGKRNGIYIFDLTATMRQLDQACRFLHDTVAEGGKVLFVGTKRQAQDLIRESAEKTEMFFVCERWLGGTLTNHQTIRRSIARMLEIEEKLESGDMAKLPKKEASSLRREHAKLHRNLSGIVGMREMPKAMVVIDVDREDIAVNEARILNIPIVALVDTNGDPRDINYVIPGNDDALRSVKAIADVLVASISSAKAIWDKKVAEEERKRQEEVKAKAEAKAAEEAAAAEAEKAEAAKAEKAEAAKAEKAEAAKAEKAKSTEKPAEPTKKAESKKDEPKKDEPKKAPAKKKAKPEKADDEQAAEATPEPEKTAEDQAEPAAPEPEKAGEETAEEATPEPEKAE